MFRLAKTPAELRWSQVQIREMNGFGKHPWLLARTQKEIKKKEKDRNYIYILRL